MTEAKRVPRNEVPALTGKVMDDGGELRLLAGADHGLQLSVMQSRVVPGSGPRRHRHPHAEVFVVHEGAGRFEIERQTFDAGPGDVLIIPSNAWHGFTNTRMEPLRLVAIHESPRAATEWEDGSRRE